MKVLVDHEVIVISILITNILSRTFLTKRGAVDDLRKGTFLQQKYPLREKMGNGAKGPPTLGDISM